MLELSESQLFVLMEMQTRELFSEEQIRMCVDITAEEIEGLAARDFIIRTPNNRYIITTKCESEIFHCFRQMLKALKEISFVSHKQGNGQIFDLANGALNWKGMKKHGN